MPLLLLLFVFWLALKGQLGTYSGFVTSGPGIQFPSLGSVTSAASKAVGGTGTPNTGYANPVLYPSTVAQGQQQVQGSSGNPPLSQSPPSSGQSAVMWPFGTSSTSNPSGTLF